MAGMREGIGRPGMRVVLRTESSGRQRPYCNSSGIVLWSLNSERGALKVLSRRTEESTGPRRWYLSLGRLAQFTVILHSVVHSVA